MQTSVFKGVEDYLRIFLHDACIALSSGDTECLYATFNGRYSAFDQLELNDYCYLFRDQILIDKRARTATLFGRYSIPRWMLDDLRFAGSLRNKYAHQIGVHVPHSNEQLADMLVVQRVVREFGKICDTAESHLTLTRALDRAIKDLVVQVAQVELPEKFDTEGELTVLGQQDREFIKEVVADSVSTLLPLVSAPVFETSSRVLEEIPIGAVSATIEAKLTKLEKKMTSLGSLKGRIDGLESALSAQLEEFQRGVHTRIDAALNDTVGICDEDYLEEEPDGIIDLAEVINGLKQQIDLISSNIPRITPVEARDELISLRKRIWAETGSGPSGDGILRKSMIDNFLYYLPRSAEEARRGNMAYWLSTVADEQIPYLDDICSILKRVITIES